VRDPRAPPDSSMPTSKRKLINPSNEKPYEEETITSQTVAARSRRVLEESMSARYTFVYKSGRTRFSLKQCCPFKCDYRCIMRLMRKVTVENIIYLFLSTKSDRSSRHLLSNDFTRWTVRWVWVCYVAGRKFSFRRTERRYICLCDLPRVSIKKTHFWMSCYGNKFQKNLMIS